MRDKIKQKIMDCLQKENGDSGLSIDDIALKIGSQDIPLVKDIVQELFSESRLIESSHAVKPYKKYKVQKQGQDLLGH
jgi:molecular chaperone DnaK (HSP70)